MLLVHGHQFPMDAPHFRFISSLVVKRLINDTNLNDWDLSKNTLQMRWPSDSDSDRFNITTVLYFSVHLIAPTTNILRRSNGNAVFHFRFLPPFTTSITQPINLTPRGVRIYYIQFTQSITTTVTRTCEWPICMSKPLISSWFPRIFSIEE